MTASGSCAVVPKAPQLRLWYAAGRPGVPAVAWDASDDGEDTAVVLVVHATRRTADAAVRVLEELPRSPHGRRVAAVAIVHDDRAKTPAGAHTTFALRVAAGRLGIPVCIAPSADAARRWLSELHGGLGDRFLRMWLEHRDALAA
ncbi:MAG: hypothetical protein D6705_15995 [Deltaproteobacteria bacterium]|nr:MAG: hypothetical protein D6705_15995 [Deltaproteobacteria bacterium]